MGQITSLFSDETTKDVKKEESAKKEESEMKIAQSSSPPYSLSELRQLSSKSTQELLSKIKKNSEKKQPPTPRILIVQNDKICPPQLIADLCQSENIPYQVVFAYYGHAFDNIEPDMYEGIIVLGGVAGAYEEDEFPWLKDLKLFMKKAILLNVPILGICLGCQLLAEVVGGKVYKGLKKPQVGYINHWKYIENNNKKDPICSIFEQYNLHHHVVLFHQDTFDLPQNVQTNDGPQQVQLLATTDRYSVLFKVGNYTYGYQAHPEACPSLVKTWLNISSNLVNQSGNSPQSLHQFCASNEQNIITSGKAMIIVWLDLVLGTNIQQHDQQLEQHDQSEVANDDDYSKLNVSVENIENGNVVVEQK